MCLESFCWAHCEFRQECNAKTVPGLQPVLVKTHLFRTYAPGFLLCSEPEQAPACDKAMSLHKGVPTPTKIKPYKVSRSSSGEVRIRVPCSFL